MADLLAIALVVLLIAWAIVALTRPRQAEPWGPIALLAAWMTLATLRLAEWA